MAKVSLSARTWSRRSAADGCGRRWLPHGLLLGSLLVCAGGHSTAHAAPAWVERGTNLPKSVWAFDPGLGSAFADPPAGDSLFGAGLNLELAVGVLTDLELGFRTGLRLGNDGRALRADGYGRLFDRQTFGTNNDSVANPELRARGRLVNGSIAELALEGRAYLPIEDYSRFGIMVGLPLLLHLGRVRLDTGLYIPIIFRERTEVDVSVPVDLWIQASQRFWIGPMSGVRIYNPDSRTDVSLGLGLGYQFTHAIDLKVMWLFPGINHSQGARSFGVGVGLQLRIE